MSFIHFYFCDKNATIIVDLTVITTRDYNLKAIITRGAQPNSTEIVGI